MSLTKSFTKNEPLIDLFIAVSSQRSEIIKEEGKHNLGGFPAIAMIDTGASHTCIDPGIVKYLKLLPTGETTIKTASTDGTPYSCYQYDVNVVIQSKGLDFTIQNLQVIGVPLKDQGIDVLLGRDILGYGMLVYNGYEKQFTIIFEKL